MAETFNGSPFTSQQITDWAAGFNGNTGAMEKAASDAGYGNLFKQASSSGLLGGTNAMGYKPTPVNQVTLPNSETTTQAAPSYQIGTAGNVDVAALKKWWGEGAGGSRTAQEIAEGADAYDMTPEQISAALGGLGYDFNTQSVKDYVAGNMSDKYGWTAGNGGLDPTKKKVIKQPDVSLGETSPYVDDQRSIDPATGTVQGQMMNLIDPNNPLMQKVINSSKQFSNSRGLLNSSMADTAAQEAMLGEARAIGTTDSGYYNTQSLANQGYANDASKTNALENNSMSKFNAGATNQSNQFNQSLAQSDSQFNADLAFKGQLSKDQLAQQMTLANLSDATQNRIAVLQAQTSQANAAMQANASSQSSANSLEAARLSTTASNRNNTMQFIYTSMANPDGGVIDATTGRPIRETWINNILAVSGLDLAYMV